MFPSDLAKQLHPPAEHLSYHLTAAFLILLPSLSADPRFFNRYFCSVKKGNNNSYEFERSNNDFCAHDSHGRDVTGVDRIDKFAFHLIVYQWKRLTQLSSGGDRGLNIIDLDTSTVLERCTSTDFRQRDHGCNILSQTGRTLISMIIVFDELVWLLTSRSRVRAPPSAALRGCWFGGCKDDGFFLLPESSDQLLPNYTCIWLAKMMLCQGPNCSFHNDPLLKARGPPGETRGSASICITNPTSCDIPLNMSFEVCLHPFHRLGFQLLLKARISFGTFA